MSRTPSASSRPASLTSISIRRSKTSRTLSAPTGRTCCQSFVRNTPVRHWHDRSRRETKTDPESRLSAKLIVLRRLYELGYNREQILGLFRFVDWVMGLPSGLERR